MSDLEVHVMPEEFVLPFIAAWRVLERCLNPIFSFPIRCSKCGRNSDAQHSQGPAFVLSSKKVNDKPLMIGVQCKTEGCNMVIKFETPISSGDDDFPQRLSGYPDSVLQKPSGTKKAVDRKDLDLIESLLELDAE